MNIKFKTENETKFNALLNEVNGRASGHTYTRFSNFAAESNNVILRIETLLGGKKHCLGVKFSIESGGSVSGGYKYSRIGTQVSLERRASGWFVTGIRRVDIGGHGGKSKITFTQAHHDQAVKVLSNGYIIAV